MMADTPTAATDLDVLTSLFKARQYRVQCDREVKEAKHNLKAAKENEAQLLDDLGGHVMKRRDELSMPKLDIPGLTLERDDIPPEER